MEERTNKHGFGLALSVKREKFWHFFSILWQLWACTWTKFPHSYQECWLILLRWLTELLGPQVPTPHCSCPPLSHHSLTVANSFLFCSGTLPFFIFFQSCRKSHTQALSVGFTPKQTKESPTERMPTTMPHTHGWLFWLGGCATVIDQQV